LNPLVRGITSVPVDTPERRKVVAHQSFDAKVQNALNGSLTSDFQKRVLGAKEKHGLTYEEVAAQAGFSGSFLGNITRYDAKVGTPTANRLAAVIEKLEGTPKGDDVVPTRGTDTPAQIQEPGGVQDRPLDNLQAVTQFAAARFGVDVSEIEVRISIGRHPHAA
jgi:hypothetical protein